MTIKSILALSLSFIALTSCYTNLKELDREVHVRIVDDMNISVQNSGNTNFSGYLSETQYRDVYLQGLRADLQANKVIIDEQNPEFEIYLSQLTVVETTKMDSINDTSSPDHGKKFELSSLDLSASGTMKRLSDGTTYTWSADKSKNESTTSSRSAAQIAAGENKDKNLYREKEFDSDEVSDLTRKVGERSGAMILRDLIRAVNQ